MGVSLDRPPTTTKLVTPFRPCVMGTLDSPVRFWPVSGRCSVGYWPDYGHGVAPVARIGRDAPFCKNLQAGSDRLSKLKRARITVSYNMRCCRRFEFSAGAHLVY